MIFGLYEMYFTGKRKLLGKI